MPLLDIHPEGKLQREVKDIIDELDIMIHVHKKQREVIKRFCKHVEHILDPDGRWKEGAVQHDRGTSRRAHSTTENMEKYIKMEEKRDQLLWFRMQSQELLAEVDDRLDELEGLKKGAESTAQSVSLTSYYAAIQVTNSEVRSPIFCLSSNNRQVSFRHGNRSSKPKRQFARDGLS